MKPPSSRGPRRARSAAPGLPAIRGEVRSAPARDTPETLETPAPAPRAMARATDRGLHQPDRRRACHAIHRSGSRLDPGGGDRPLPRRGRSLAHSGLRSVVDKVTREWIGLIALNRLGPGIRGVDEDEIEVGWWLVPTAWRRGIATEGARAACAEAFMCVGVTPAVPRCRPANQRSLAVMERIGIRRGSRPSGATAKSSASTPWIVPRGSAPPAPGHRREHRLRRPAVDGRGSLRRLRGQCTVEPC